MEALSPEPEIPQTFVFADLAGYTALTEIHGDRHAADAAADFFRATRTLLDSHDAEEIKSIGDALMLRSSNATQAARLAERIVCDYGSRHRALGIRVGMHTGPAVQRGADWFGAAVNVASRVADSARAGEVLLTAETRNAIGQSVPTRRLGARRLKNVSEPVEIYELVLDTTAQVLPIDPVCRMTLDPVLAPEQRVYRGTTYFLCSRTCAQRFDLEPSRYTRS
jgi:class 3 adenylate cyclase